MEIINVHGKREPPLEFSKHDVRGADAAAAVEDCCCTSAKLRKLDEEKSRCQKSTRIIDVDKGGKRKLN